MNHTNFLEFQSIFENDLKHGVWYHSFGGFPFYCLDAGQTINEDLETRIEGFFSRMSIQRGFELDIFA